MADPHPPLIWIDMEMTGLDPDIEKVLEIATLITNGDLEVIAEGPELVIHQPDEVLDAMGEWCREHHGASGLTDQSRRSTIDVHEAERQTLAFIQTHCHPGQSPLCGNTIGQDRRFLVRHMPAIDRFLHYRSVDVTTLKELCQRWYPELPGIAKTESHRALDDIRESIAELRYYREHVFVKPPL
ncbi:oligoribonuclease [Enhygromyxa salina]|uniref:Oligoribonuclease n=1 Tax=Enhygromyxa salina TaxID=215803 RepID=A0A2S9XL74_9BACT|nr:oligoribonuclease [Enhygromyxa salina]PRP93638.1 Oligoribonuclease [Enhygromyxa salina]